MYIVENRPGSKLAHSVQINDMAFALHAFTISALTLLQYIFYPHDAHDPRRHLSGYNGWHAALLSIMWTLSLYNVVLAFMGYMPWYNTSNGKVKLTVIDFLGDIKVAITRTRVHAVHSMLLCFTNSRAICVCVCVWQW